MTATAAAAAAAMKEQQTKSSSRTFFIKRTNMPKHQTPLSSAQPRLLTAAARRH